MAKSGLQILCLARCARGTTHFALTLPQFRNSDSAAEKIWLQPFVSVLVRPERQRNRRKVVNDRHRVAILREVDRSNKKHACVASLHANVRKLLRDVNRKFLFILLAACRTEDAPEAPLISAKGANQESFSSVSFHSHYSQHRLSAAQRALSRRLQHRRDRRPACHAGGVRLQKSPQKELFERSNFLAGKPSVFPIFR